MRIRTPLVRMRILPPQVRGWVSERSSVSSVHFRLVWRGMTSELPTSSKKRTLLGIFIPVAIILLVAWGALMLLKSSVTPRSSGTLEVKVGAVLPDLAFHRVDGTAYRLSESKARVILVNFWATWCEACMEEMPSLVKLFDTYREKGLEIIGVNLDEEPVRAIAATTQEFRIQFANFVDKDEALGSAFDVHAIPLTITVDSTRKILEVKAGDRDWMAPEYLRKLEGWLAK